MTTYEEVCCWLHFYTRCKKVVADRAATHCGGLQNKQYLKRLLPFDKYHLFSNILRNNNLSVFYQTLS